MLVSTSIPYATTIVVLIVLLSFFVPAAALGGSAFVAIVIGFAAQRFLMDVIAGGLIALERWYAVGDFVMIEPSKAAGIVEQFGFRTTVLRALNGDRAYVPNSQIITAFWSPRGYRRYSIELLAGDPDEAQRAIGEVGRRGPAGQARFLRPPRVVEVRELEDGAWLVRGVVDVAPTMEWLAEGPARRRSKGTAARRRPAGGSHRLHTRRGNVVAVRAPGPDQLRRLPMSNRGGSVLTETEMS